MSFHELEVKTIQGESQTLDTYTGKYCLIVNVASKCGLTPQYAGLEALYQEFKSQNVEVLGFPCNQFGSQEPGTNEEICEFAQGRYNATFPLFEKIEVNGEGASELYTYLTQAKSNPAGKPDIAWNFTKFLIDPKGVVLERFEPTVSPEAIAEKIRSLLSS